MRIVFSEKRREMVASTYYGANGESPTFLMTDERHGVALRAGDSR
jgi:hypothetical protein